MRGVAVSFDRDVRTCRHVVGKLVSRHHPSGTRGLNGIAAGVSAHEVLEASCVVLAVCEALPGALGKARHLWNRSCDARAGTVCCGLGRNVKFGHQLVVRCELSFGNGRVCDDQCALSSYQVV